VEEAEILRALLDLAGEAGLPVRRIAGRAGGEGEPSASSAVCRVRGDTWVVLSEADPPRARIAVLCRGLRQQAPDLLEGRYLPPALRQHLAGDSEPT
jgi:hypothetical protein